MVEPSPVGSYAPNATAAIILGASAWPKYQQLRGSLSFGNSAEAIRAYFSDRVYGLGISDTNILSLFDSAAPAYSQVDNIGKFLKAVRKSLQDGGADLQDVLIYYVGHGSFPEASNELFLLVRESDPDEWDTTCILIKTLAHRIKRNVPFARQIVILDCCFSGAAVPHWQSSQGAPIAIKASIEPTAPGSGAVLLCSSASDAVSLAPPEAKYTMFTGSLLKALKRGHDKLGPYLTPSDTRELTWEAMKLEWGARAVRPIATSIDRGHGDLLSYQLFRNPASAEPASTREAFKRVETESDIVRKETELDTISAKQDWETLKKQVIFGIRPDLQPNPKVNNRKKESNPTIVKWEPSPLDANTSLRLLQRSGYKINAPSSRHSQWELSIPEGATIQAHDDVAFERTMKDEARLLLINWYRRLIEMPTGSDTIVGGVRVEKRQNREGKFEFVADKTYQTIDEFLGALRNRDLS